MKKINRNLCRENDAKKSPKKYMETAQKIPTEI